MKSFRVVAAVLVLAIVTPVHADTAKCEKTLLSGLRKYKKTYLKAFEKCLDAENEGKISGTPPVCPDVGAQVKIGTAASKINAKIDLACAPADLSGLGYGTSCALETAETAAETACAGMPAATGAELAACLECWKAAELAELVAITYASHAVEVCGALDGSSTACSGLDCTTPQPNQANLGVSSDETCQRAIAKAGFKYVLKREKTLEACGLAGQTRAQCLDVMTNPKVALALSKIETSKTTLIKNKCGNNRTPTASPPFCCRTGTGNACMAATTRDECTMTLGGQVMEGKTCDVGGTNKCSGGGGTITWWENCPEGATCPGAPVTSMNELIACLDTTADTIVDEMLCLQFPPGSGWDCPSEGSTTTTTATTTTTSTTTGCGANGTSCSVAADCCSNACSSSVCCVDRKCASNPCADSGDAAAACSDHVAPAIGYNCTCDAGFISNGFTCVSGCGIASDPCGNGTCSGSAGSWSCSCPVGYMSTGGTHPSCIPDDACIP